MKIGITCYSTYGGSGVVATELGKCLANRGHEVHFITKDIPFRLEHTFHEKIFFHQVEIMEYPLFGSDSHYTLGLASKMAQVANDENLDVLHVHYAIPHAISAYLAQQMLKNKKLPIVTTLHGTDITLVGQDPSFFDITKFSIEQSTIVTGVSDFLINQTKEIFKTEKEIHRVYNFVDTNLFQLKSNPCRQKMGIDTVQKVFVHLSNFRPVKRSYDVVKTFNLILKEVPDAVLLMAGEGPLLGECRALVKEYGISSRVQFLGKVQDIISLLDMSDIMLFPSELESFGLAALEANACGIPVIGSTSGGTHEAVLEGETGFLFDVGDIEGMAKKSIELALDCEFRTKIGNQGRKRALEKFSPDTIIPQYEQLYQKAIAMMS